MPGRDAPIDLRLLSLPEGSALDLTLELSPITLRLGGQDYAVAGADRAQISLSRSSSGLQLRLRVAGALTGPCWRCLTEAAVPVTIDAHEFAAASAGVLVGPDHDMGSIYVEDEHVDGALWARDAFAEAVPPTILCRPDCAGLCAQCGADRNEGACTCATTATDSRWDELRAAAERLGIAPDNDDD